MYQWLIEAPTMTIDFPFVASALPANSRASWITVSRPIFVNCSCQAGVYGPDVVVARRVVAGEAAPDAELREEQVVDRGDDDLAPVGGAHAPHRHAAEPRLVGRELVEGDLRDLGARRAEEGEHGIDRRVVEPVLELEVPLALLGVVLRPAEADRALRHPRRVRAGVPHEQLPVAVLDVRVAVDRVGPQELAGREPGRRLDELDEQRAVGRALEVVREVRHLALRVELLEDHVVDGEPESRVLAGLDRQPPVGVLRDHAEVRRDDDELRALVPCLGDEVDVGRPRHAEVGADRPRCTWS